MTDKSSRPTTLPDFLRASQEDSEKVRCAIEDMVRTWATLAEHAPEIAAHRRRMFDAYVGAGFTEAQALELCKALL